jgi:hypothetical protein
MSTHSRSHQLEEELIRKEASDFERSKAFQKLAEELEVKNEKLTKALKVASDHLDYCGYGDSWERECARAAKLPEQIAEVGQ